MRMVREPETGLRSVLAIADVARRVAPEEGFLYKGQGSECSAARLAH